MINNTVLMGRLTADPELRTTQSGKSVCSFQLAVERDFVDKEGNRPTDFIFCVAWSGTAKFIDKHFSKGKMLAVQGSMQSRNYEDKQGNKRTAIELLVTQASFTGEKSGKPGAETEEALPPEDAPPA